MNENQEADRYLEHPVAAGFGGGGALRSRLRRWLVGQFGRPAGGLGHLAGWIMANRRSNVERNRWTVALLEVQPADRVLEIGFGPGIALQAICERLVTGNVSGVDHSAVMVRQAARRNRRGVATGQVRLVEGDPAALPPTAGPFDKVLAVNVAMFWQDPVSVLRGLRERMAPGGRIALTLQPRTARASEEDARRAGERIADHLRRAGFREVRIERKPLRPVSAVCALGER